MELIRLINKYNYDISRVPQDGEQEADQITVALPDAELADFFRARQRAARKAEEFLLARYDLPTLHDHPNTHNPVLVYRPVEMRTTPVLDNAPVMHSVIYVEPHIAQVPIGDSTYAEYQLHVITPTELTGVPLLASGLGTEIGVVRFSTGDAPTLEARNGIAEYLALLRDMGNEGIQLESPESFIYR